MRYSFTTVTFALLAMTIHASPIQLQPREEMPMAMAEPKPSNPVPAEAPPATASASITETSPLANGTSSASGPASSDTCVLTGGGSTTMTTTVTNPATNTTGTVFPGTATNCTTFYIVLAGDTCNGIDSKVGIPFDQLRKLNTGVNPQWKFLVTAIKIHWKVSRSTMEPFTRNKRKGSLASEDLETREEAATAKKQDTTCEERENTEDYEQYEGTIRVVDRTTEKQVGDSWFWDDEREKQNASPASVKSACVRFGKYLEVLEWQSGHAPVHEWREDFKEYEWAGVVWYDSVIPWKESLEEDQDLAARLCNFETPSEKAGLILDCPVEEYQEAEEEIPNPEVVELCVGLGKKVIRVNKRLLCKKIPYFSKMFQGSFQEATSNSASFPEDEVEAFDDLVYWVSNGHLPPCTIYHETEGFYPNQEIQGIAPVRIAFGYDFLELYALADKFCIFNLMNLITDYVIGLLALDASVLPIQDISDIYANAPENSGLRRLACYIFNYYIESCSKVRYPVKDLAYLLRTVDDLALDTINLKRSQAGEPFVLPEDLAACEFHEHSNGEICEGKKFRERTPGLRRPQKLHPQRIRLQYLTYE
ncbi:hypothetical protein EYC80_007602 [Monilinia laxa]|uniref:LysM domain-containing protein n=1 Tax=Monilinia laxa TaxID=61186 RepID=A0A5N6JWF2_MONLA|nr:hypothetical protein EYC80_007602 [Monilinia laxa]